MLTSDKLHFMQKSKISCTTFMLFVGISLAGCTTQQGVVQNDEQSLSELTNALKLSAERAANARVALSQIKPVSSSSPMPGEPKLPTAALDIDFVGPVSQATQIVARSIGWQFSENGKKRQEVLASLRHSNSDALTILRDIGAQCALKCDIHVSLIEGGQSSVELTWRD